MSPTEPAGNGRWMLWCSLALFIVFVLLAGYHKYRNTLIAKFSDVVNVSLLDELATANILEEPEPLGIAWPQWRGERRDGVAYGKNLRLDWSDDGPETLWKIKGGDGYSSFAVFAGRAFTMLREGDNEIVVCLDVNDKGKHLWTFDYPCTFINDYGSGPRSTPTLDREPYRTLSAVAGPYARAASLLPGDRLYTVGADGKFHCLDAVTGKALWHKDLLGEFHAANLPWGVAFSPLIEGDLVITTPGGHEASIVAFDKYSGEKKWASQSDQAGYSSPVAVTAAGQRQIIVFAGKVLLSVSPQDGRLFWRYPWEVNADVNAATPLVFHAEKDGRELAYVFISSGYDRGCALLKVFADEKSKGEPQVSEVYVNKQMSNQFSTSVRYGDCLYGFNESKLKCLDLKTGKEKWSESGFHKGSLLRVEDRLIVLGENGKLAVFEATPGTTASKIEDSRALALSRVIRNPHVRCWTMPVLADGKLLVRDREEILCLDLSKSE
jgi:outer membrane protein assembly factor BamB